MCTVSGKGAESEVEPEIRSEVEPEIRSEVEPEIRSEVNPEPEKGESINKNTPGFGIVYCITGFLGVFLQWRR